VVRGFELEVTPGVNLKVHVQVHVPPGNRTQVSFQSGSAGCGVCFDCVESRSCRPNACEQREVSSKDVHLGVTDFEKCEALGNRADANAFRFICATPAV